MSKYGAFSDPYFPVFGLNTKIHGVNLRIQSEYRKIRTRKNLCPYLDTFHAVGKLHSRRRMDKKGKNDDFIYKYQLKKTCGMFKSSLKFSVVILIILTISPYSARMRENTDQNNSKY